MHASDFRADLEPTRLQYRRIAEELCRLAGESAPPSRAAAAELILRLERSDSPAVVAAADLARRDALPSPGDIVTGNRGSARQRAARSRTGASR